MSKKHVRFARLLLKVTGRHNEISLEEFSGSLHHYRKFMEDVESTFPGAEGSTQEMMKIIFELRHLLFKLEREGVDLGKDGLPLAMILAGKTSVEGMMFYALGCAMEEEPVPVVLRDQVPQRHVHQTPYFMKQPSQGVPIPVPTHPAPRTLQ